MARVTSHINKTAGQGIMRGTYQKVRAMTPKGLSPMKNAPAGQGTPGVASGVRAYPKNGPTGASMNVAYSEREMANPNLSALSQAPTTAVPPLRGGGKVPKSPKGFLG